MSPDQRMREWISRQQYTPASPDHPYAAYVNQAISNRLARMYFEEFPRAKRFVPPADLQPADDDPDFFYG